MSVTKKELVDLGTFEVISCVLRISEPYAMYGDDDLLKMYKKEYQSFRSILYRPGKHDAMWRHLDFLMGDTFDANSIMRKFK